METTVTIMTYLNIGVAVAMVLGGAIAFRYGMNRTANEIQERVIHALQSEIQLLQDRVVVLEKDNTRLSDIIALIRSALKQHGLSVTIDGEVISIHDTQGNSTHVSRIHGSSQGAAGQAESVVVSKEL
jgi:hypothetical protein